MNGNPLITYDEIVDALKSILECSISGGYTDDLNYLNIKYEPSIKNKIDSEKEKKLYAAIKSLEKNIDIYSKVVRSNLERDLYGIDENIIKLDLNYLIGQERRRLSAQQFFVKKLKGASLKKSVLLNPVEDIEDNMHDLDDIDTNKVFSEFEKQIISSFPSYFGNDIHIKNDNEIGEISPTSNYVVPDEIKVRDNDRLNLFRGAIEKAKKIGNKDLIEKLEEKYQEELNK